MKQTSVLLMIIIALSSLTGCVIHPPVQPGDPYYAPVLKTREQPPAALNGSLYQESEGLDLFSDGRASNIGDLITVVLQERTSSSKSSNVEVLKENEIGIGPGGTVLGSTPSAGEFGLTTNLSSSKEFTGEAEADQSNRLSGNISVTVVDVYPNGTLVIRGEKWITLNRGSEFIRISGLVRPEDVSPDNSVPSTKIANARIAYSGTGELADSQQMGWLTRFFNSPIWPF